MKFKYLHNNTKPSIDLSPFILLQNNQSKGERNIILASNNSMAHRQRNPKYIRFKNLDTSST